MTRHPIDKRKTLKTPKAIKQLAAIEKATQRLIADSEDLIANPNVPEPLRQKLEDGLPHAQAQLQRIAALQKTAAKRDLAFIDEVVKLFEKQEKQGRKE